VKDYIERQMEISDKLFKVMFEDHKERVRDLVMWAELDASLIKKLNERDIEIEKLKARITELENK
jgi:hypothetical protein